MLPFFNADGTGVIQSTLDLKLNILNLHLAAMAALLQQIVTKKLLEFTKNKLSF